MEIDLDAIEARVLGSLIEKELATPEYYPLSLNALINACNQKSNRDPVTAYDEAAVASAADMLATKGLVWKSNVGRVPKYEERFTQERSLVPRESAVICILLLRGPQTVGEIRGRSARLFEFESLEQVQEALNNLAEWGYASQLPRMPGHKEPRYRDLLREAVEPEAGEAAVVAAVQPQMDIARIEKIEAALEWMQSEVEDLKSAFEQFKKQFE